jgi:hypothetical protein
MTRHATSRAARRGELAPAPSTGHICQICTAAVQVSIEPVPAPNGGSARGYQAIFVASATLGSPGYDGQPAVYLYIAALEVNVLNCRDGRVKEMPTAVR